MVWPVAAQLLFAVADTPQISPFATVPIKPQVFKISRRPGICPLPSLKLKHLKAYNLGPAVPFACWCDPVSQMLALGRIIV